MPPDTLLPKFVIRQLYLRVQLAGIQVQPRSYKQIVLLKVNLLVLSVSDLNNNHDVIFQCAVIRHIQVLSCFTCCSPILVSPSLSLHGSCRIPHLEDKHTLKVTKR